LNYIVRLAYSLRQILHSKLMNKLFKKLGVPIRTVITMIIIMFMIYKKLVKKRLGIYFLLFNVEDSPRSDEARHESDRD